MLVTEMPFNRYWYSPPKIWSTQNEKNGNMKRQGVDERNEKNQIHIRTDCLRA